MTYQVFITAQAEKELERELAWSRARWGKQLDVPITSKTNVTPKSSPPIHFSKKAGRHSQALPLSA
jgi:hypothetical protein